MNFRPLSPEPERTIAVRPAPPQNRAAEQTIKQVSEGGLPVNPHVLSQIVEKLEAGTYRNAPDKLVSDIKQDPGLLFSCLRNLQSVTQVDAALENPIQALLELEEEKLLSVVTGGGAQWRQHSFKDGTKLQALRYQHAMLSTLAAEGIAEKLNVSKELGFAAAFLREVALALLAWNYPHVYQKAVQSHRAHKIDVELELQKQLGISPAELAVAIAQQMGVRGPIKKAMLLLGGPNRGRFSIEVEKDETVRALVKVTEAAKQYADSEDSYTYPHFGKISGSVSAEYDALLPAAERMEIARAVASRIEASQLPGEFQKLPIVAQLKAATVQPKVNHGLEDNSFAQRLIPAQRSLFEPVYAQLDGTQQLSKAALLELSEVTIPQLGFAHGCLYMRQSEYGPLIPVLRVGPKALKEYTLGLASWHQLIAASADSTLPFRSEGRGSEDYGSVYICAALGHSIYKGVLFLELDESASADVLHPSILLFQAIRQAINDSLGAGRAVTLRSV